MAAAVEQTLAAMKHIQKVLPSLQNLGGQLLQIASGTIQARSLTIVNDAGIPVVFLSSSQAGAGRVGVRNAEGQPVANLDVDADGAGGLIILDRECHLVAMVQVRDGAGRLDLVRPADQKVVSFGT
jgi:hypothetical protein